MFGKFYLVVVATGEYMYADYLIQLSILNETNYLDINLNWNKLLERRRKEANLSYKITD